MILIQGELAQKAGSKTHHSAYCWRRGAHQYVLKSSGVTPGFVGDPNGETAATISTKYAMMKNKTNNIIIKISKGLSESGITSCLFPLISFSFVVYPNQSKYFLVVFKSKQTTNVHQKKSFFERMNLY